jgi:hypothetical protein
MTKSAEPGQPTTWDENWILLRKLWPEWKPNDDQIREVWFKSFDKKHGTKGANRVNQDALREGIIGVARSKRFRDPEFLDISDAYRHESNRVLAEIDRARMNSVSIDQQIELDDQERRNRDTVGRWSSSRLFAARAMLERKITTFRGKSSDPESWSRVYVGFLVAADAEVQRGDDE